MSEFGSGPKQQIYDEVMYQKGQNDLSDKEIMKILAEIIAYIGDGE